MKTSTKTKGIIGWIITAWLCIQALVPAAHAISWDAYYSDMNTAGTPTADA